MGVLDTFYAVFKADTSDLKKGTKEAEKALDDTAQKAKTSAASINQFSGSLFRAAQGAARLASGLVSVGSFIYASRNAEAYTEEIARNSRELSINATTLDAWQRSVVLSGGKAEDFTATIRRLSEKYNLTTEGVVKSLPKIANVFSKLSGFRANKLAAAIGIDQSTLLLLRQGSTAVQDLVQKQKDFGALTKKDIEVVTAYSRQWNEWKINFRSAFTEINTFALPVLTRFIELLNKGFEYLFTHKDLLIGVFTGAAVAAGGLLAPALIKAAKAFIALDIASLPYTIVLGAIAAGVALVTEDFLIWKKGGDSLIGMILNLTKTNPLIKSFFGVINTSAKITYDLIMGLIHGIGKLASIFPNVTAGEQYAYLAAKNIDVASTNVFTAIPKGVNSIAESNKSLNVQIDNITVNTQATDAGQIATDFQKSLYAQIYHAQYASSSGVLI